MLSVFDANLSLELQGVSLDSSKVFDSIWHDGVLYKLDIHGESLLNPFYATDLFISPENVRKPQVFWCFQGV